MVVTDDTAAAERLRHLSTQARQASAYRHDEIGFNYRMTNLNAAVGLAQLERLDEMLAAKRAIAARYDRALDGRDDIVAMPRCDWASSSCWLFVVRCASARSARGLVDHLAAQSIQSSVFWESLSEQAPYRAAPGTLADRSRALSGCVVALPCSSGLASADRDRVIAALDDRRGEQAAP